MRQSNKRRIAFGSFLLGTTFLVSPALAGPYNNQVNATALSATNNDSVYSNSTLGQPQTINSGIINNIGAAATGALGIASVNQTISQSTITQGGNALAGNQVSVTTISATNDTTGAPAPGATANIEATATVSTYALIGDTIFNINRTAGGLGNSIGTSATAAAAQANITQSFDTNSATDLTTLPANSVVATTITATNTAGSVLSSFTFTGAGVAEINNGVGNSIAAQAVGAAASASIATRTLDTTTAGTAGLATPATNSVQTGNLSATNNGTVTATALTTGDLAAVDNGIGNMVGATAFGASGGAGITQVVAFTTGGTAALDTVYSNSVNSGSITVTNNATGVVQATVGSPTALTGVLISNGIGGAIVAQAVGAGASNSITQEFKNVTTEAGPSGFTAANAATNSVTTGSPLPTNLANVTATWNGANSAGISAGIGNTIGASAVGAAANVSIAQSIQGSTFSTSDHLGGNTATMNSTTGEVAINGATTPVVAAIQATLTETGTSTVTNGVGNSISASAVGASTTAGIDQSILGSSGNLTLLGSNSVVIADHGGGTVNGAVAAYNFGASPVTATLNQTGAATISDGVGNSISAQAIGATAGASISSRLDNTTTTGNGPTVGTNTVNTTAGTSAGWDDVFGSNTGAVTAHFVNGNSTTSANILTGVGNNIGAAAVGGAGADSISQVVAFDTASGANTVATLSLFGNSISSGDVAGSNTGAILSTISIPGNTVIGTLNTTGTFGGVGNSIAAQGIGASASASISSHFYNVDNTTATLTTPATNVIADTTAPFVIDVTANNSGTVTVTANIGTAPPTATTTAEINNGVANFIGASAIGASAGASISQSVSAASGTLPFNMTQLPGNEIIVNGGTGIEATNNSTGIVLASLTNPGSTVIGVNPSSLAASTGNVGNSISAQGVGAAATASITTQVFNATLTQSALPLASNTVQYSSISSTNGAPVSATGTFGTAGQATLVSIGGGVGNSIGASATGASSTASINQIVSTASAGSTLNTLPTNSITPVGAGGSITAMNNGVITASLTTLGTIGTTIAGGVGNSISAGAVGASAGASIAQSIANVK